jgi:hypothetical protein
VICPRGRNDERDVVVTYPLESREEMSRIQSSGGKRFVFEEDENLQGR